MSVCSLSENGNLVGLKRSPEEGVANRSLKDPLRRAGLVHPHGVEDTPVAFVHVEAVVQELTKETSGLRLAERVGRLAVNRQIRTVAKRRCGVTDSGEADAGDHRSAGLIRHAIEPPGIESFIQLDLRQTVRAGHESPTGPGNSRACIQEMVADDQEVLRVR